MPGSGPWMSRAHGTLQKIYSWFFNPIITIKNSLEIFRDDTKIENENNINKVFVKDVHLTFVALILRIKLSR